MQTDLIVYIGVFIVLLAIGIPIHLSLIVPSIIYFMMNPQLSMMLATQRMLVSLNSFPLMAIPFFILAANIMSGGSISNRIFTMAKAFVGRFPGGLAYVNILNSIIFAGMSGSALADVGGPGMVEYRAMVDHGYGEDFSAGLTLASGTIGPIIPPSIPFVVYAAYSSLSVGALFMGGIIPGLVIAIALGVQTYIVTKIRRYPAEEPVGIKSTLKSIKNGFPALLMPLIIIGGMWIGWFTATEAALVSTVYAIILVCGIYRDLNFKGLVKILRDTAEGVVPILMVVIGANLFSWIMVYENIDDKILNIIMSITDNKQVVMLMVVIIVLFLGMFFDSIVAILLLIPIMIPICQIYGINPIHMGVVITLGNMIGLVTPPVGMSLYLMASITGVPVGKMIRNAAPWLISLVVAWLLVAFWEPFTMFIPNLMQLGK
jgi:tripartite ATP-independent transporter DctM subunit